MLHIPYLREHKNEIIKKLKIKNFEANEIIENLLIKDDERKTTQKELDDLLSKSNHAFNDWRLNPRSFFILNQKIPTPQISM